MSIKPLTYTGPEIVPGFVFSGLAAGIKKKPDVLDLALIQTTTPKAASLAGLFTINCVKAAPVVLGIERLKKGRCRAVLVNSGNANACTGPQGRTDALQMGRWLAERLACTEEEIQVSSTGVIGAQLPMVKIQNAIPLLVQNAAPDKLEQAAQAIRTTDIFEKRFGMTVDIDGKRITLCGIAKGSGMIAPNMATMLAYIMTDAAISPAVLQQALQEANESTFNAITVDGEMSTNDTILMLANGHAQNPEIQPGTKAYEVFVQAATAVCDFLARQIVRDGEGSTKFVELKVSGLENAAHLKAIAMAIGNSPLVKTAICGEDANWGRILSAAGACAARLGLEANFDKASILFNDTAVLKDGVPQGADAEAKAHAIMMQDTFNLNVILGPAKTAQKIYFTDFTKDYIRINAEYRS